MGLLGAGSSGEINAGDRIERYQIVALIGEGSFAEVFLAWDPALNRNIAIKVSKPPDGYTDTDTILQNEARILAELRHPAILTVFDIGWVAGRFYAVLEYLEGSLAKEIKEPSISLSYERLAEITADVADTLDYVHRRGYLHRNVKPRVILLDATGRARLSGFEVAVQREDLDSLSDKGLVGTLPYMAPEQLNGEVDLMGPHTDVWGLGATLYEALTRKQPFGEPPYGFLVRLGRNPTPLRRLAPDIPQELERICLKCLSGDPKDRFPTAEMLAQELRAWRRGAKPPRQQRVFVSHSSKDRQFVEQEIIGLLEKAGIKTWYSKAAIETAAEWERSILQGLQSCEWFLLVMSPRSATSEWVKDEIHWAIENRAGRIIPVMVEDCDPRQFHIRMARLQYVDFCGNLQEARQTLIGVFDKSETAA